VGREILRASLLLEVDNAISSFDPPFLYLPVLLTYFLSGPVTFTSCHLVLELGQASTECGARLCNQQKLVGW